MWICQCKEEGNCLVGSIGRDFQGGITSLQVCVKCFSSPSKPWYVIDRTSVLPLSSSNYGGSLAVGLGTSGQTEC